MIVLRVFDGLTSNLRERHIAFTACDYLFSPGHTDAATRLQTSNPDVICMLFQTVTLYQCVARASQPC